MSDENRRTGFCHGCGAKLSPLSHRRGGATVYEVTGVKQHRPVNPHPAEGVYIEQSPRLMMYAHVLRNGGPEDDLCDECVKIGAQILRRRLTEIIGDGA